MGKWPAEKQQERKIQVGIKYRNLSQLFWSIGDKIPPLKLFKLPDSHQAKHWLFTISDIISKMKSEKTYKGDVKFNNRKYLKPLSVVRPN